MTPFHFIQGANGLGNLAQILNPDIRCRLMKSKSSIDQADHLASGASGGQQPVIGIFHCRAGRAGKPQLTAGR